MKGRIFIVGKEFIKNLNDNMCIEIKIPKPNADPNKKWFKTITDILADAFQLQLGDYVFFWQLKENNPDTYIRGIYRVISNPFYEDNLFKLKIEEAYHFENPITEYDILNDPYNKFNLWNIIGKKIAGKPRASSPLTDYEIEFLTQKLIDKNPDYTYYKPQKSHYENIHITNEVFINLDNNNKNIVPKDLNSFKPNEILYLNDDKTIQYEKFMELLFNLKFKEHNASFFKSFNINIDNVLWYANYLPYTVGRKEIDYLILESKDNYVIDKFNLIEFKLKTIDMEHIKRCLLYAEWLNNNLGKGAKLTQPIIVCESVSDRQLANYNRQIPTLKLENKDKPLQIYTIKYNDNKWDIKKVR